MVLSTNLGLPRIGAQRELKRAIEAYWSGAADARHVDATARALRADGRRRQLAAGIDLAVSGDFSLYDHVLDAACLLGAVPERFSAHGGVGTDNVDLDTYFALARGREGDGAGAGATAAPLEMTKWFDTNYHFLVPEVGPQTPFRMAATKPLDELAEARSAGMHTRPVLLGPVSFLLLAKGDRPGSAPLSALSQVVAVYAQVLAALAQAGAQWVQLDEPCLVTDLDRAARHAYVTAYRTLAGSAGCRLMLATYFGGLGDNLPLALGLPVDALHVDVVRAPYELDAIVDELPRSMVLSAGVVDGRNVWRNDLSRSLDVLEPAVERLGPERVWVAPSCSLLHVPYSLADEAGIDPEVRAQLAFADEKLREVATLAAALDGGRRTRQAELDASDAAIEAARRARHGAARNAVRQRIAALAPADAHRSSPYAVRHELQRRAHPLPVLPTTTIGSFPQTAEIRKARRQHTLGVLDDRSYRRFCEDEIARVVRVQEDIGLDVLVHGEPERNDMVQYFGEHLDGFVTTANGWVQSYGTRCVRPPILHGDVARREPITVEWLRHAQSLTPAPVKGMLTGPVTILQWSFVRDDQPRAETCRQVALAIRDEVADLERAGIGIIQVDEPALREGLPLRRAARDDYLSWATECFRIATSVVADWTQIHTHMCYAEFRDVLPAVQAMDVDVISLEAARSGLDMLGALADAGHGTAIGPGVYDIHSPRVPTRDEMVAVLRQTCAVFPVERIWVNPDCGLKTRRWDEVVAALRNMVAAAHELRAELVGTDVR